MDLIQISMFSFIAVLLNKAPSSNITTVRTIVYETTNVNVSNVCPTCPRASNVYTSLHVIYWTRNAIIAVNDPLYFRWMIVF